MFNSRDVQCVPNFSVVNLVIENSTTLHFYPTVILHNAQRTAAIYISITRFVCADAIAIE